MCLSSQAISHYWILSSSCQNHVFTIQNFCDSNQSLDSWDKEIPNLENMQVIFLKNSFISTLIDFFSPSIIHQETLATLFLLCDIANLQDEPCSQYHKLAMHGGRVLSFYPTSVHDPDNATVSNFVLQVWWLRRQLWSILVWASTLGLIVML